MVFLWEYMYFFIVLVREGLGLAWGSAPLPHALCKCCHTMVQAAAPYKRGAARGPACMGRVLQGALSTVEMGGLKPER